MKTILLTGATGYLGGYLSERFLSKEYKIIALCLNRTEIYKFQNNKNVKVYYLSDTTLKNIFDENKIDVVVHTATLYGREGENLSKMIQVNIMFPCEILELAVKNNVECFINTDSILNRNINYYSMTKGQFSEWLDFYSDKIKCVNLKLDHFYGPNDKSTKFIAWLFEQFRNNVEEINLTEGSQTRDFIYVDDVVNAFDCVLQNIKKLSNVKVSNFEVGTNCKTSIRDLVLMIQKYTNNYETKLNFGVVPYRKNEVLDYEIDTHALRLLGLSAKTPIEEGLKNI